MIICDISIDSLHTGVIEAIYTNAERHVVEIHICSLNSGIDVLRGIHTPKNAPDGYTVMRLPQAATARTITWSDVRDEQQVCFGFVSGDVLTINAQTITLVLY